MRARLVALTFLLIGCGTSTPPAEPAIPAPPTARAATNEWVTSTRSPWPVDVIDERLTAVGEACGAPDGALVRVAARLAAERARGLGAPDPDRIAGLLRAEGEPHVRPRVVSGTRRTLEDGSFQSALAGGRTTRTRCGLAIASPDHASGKEGDALVVAVAVDALADLEPLPTRARTGEWLSFAARLHAPASSAKLLVLGPRGLPRTVPTSLDRKSGTVKARFALDQPGAFTVQLVGDLENGPTPLLEARVFADVEPTSEEGPTRAPGEDALRDAGGDDADALAAMILGLRSAESAPALVRDARLDAIALAHAEEMKRARRAAHDVGEGDLTRRFDDAALSAKVVGENVARARSIVLAHRALHASPSHRLNLLRADYTHVGVGVVHDERGDVWACEVFAGGLR